MKKLLLLILIAISFSLTGCNDDLEPTDSTVETTKPTEDKPTTKPSEDKPTEEPNSTPSTDKPETTPSTEDTTNPNKDTDVELPWV